MRGRQSITIWREIAGYIPRSNLPKKLCFEGVACLSAIFSNPRSAQRAVEDLNGMSVPGVRDLIIAYRVNQNQYGTELHKIVNGIRHAAKSYQIVERGVTKKVLGSGQQLFFANAPIHFSLTDLSTWLTNEGIPLILVEFAQPQTRGHGFISISDDSMVLQVQAYLNGAYLGGRPVEVHVSNWFQASISNAV